MRQLITLISAGRNCTIVIRRELPLEAIGGMLPFVHIVKRGLQGQLLKTHLALHPVHMLVGPVLFDVLRSFAAVAEQRLPQPLAGPLLKASGRSGSSWLRSLANLMFVNMLLIANRQAV